MNNKAYRLGIMVGRFQSIHSGHEMMINKALEICDKVGILIGSSQESGTLKNPFSYEERKEMLEEIFGEKLMIFPLPDIGVGNNCKWGEYVIENIKKDFGSLPDLVISGKESRRASWFDSEEAENISELFIPKTIEISASEMRDHFINNDFEAWKKYTNPALWSKYESLRATVLASKDNLETKSI